MKMVCKVFIFTQLSVIFIFLNEKNNFAFYFCFYLTDFYIDPNFVLVEMLEMKRWKRGKTLKQQKL